MPLERVKAEQRLLEVSYRSSDGCSSLEFAGVALVLSRIACQTEKNNNNWIDLICTVNLNKGFCCDLLFKYVGLVPLTEKFSSLVLGSNSVLLTYLGTAVAQWLRCCAINRKVAGSIPAGVSGFFIDIKSFRSHYGPGLDSASNRNEYQEYFLGVKAAGA